MGPNGSATMISVPRSTLVSTVGSNHQPASRSILRPPDSTTAPSLTAEATSCSMA